MIEVHEVPRLPRRAADSHKGTFGRVLVVAGSRTMPGAAVLCGSAALRSGAGLVQVATPAAAWPVVAAGNPCYTTFSWDDESAIPSLVRLAGLADVVAVGPGLGSEVGSLVTDLLKSLNDKPMVLDADALNALGVEPAELAAHGGSLVLTPHPGEFARLIGKSATEVQAHREELAVAFAKRHRVVLLLKGNGTLVTDGDRLYKNATGNPGMATGGAGDVLTGAIAALIGQGFTSFDAAVLGAWAHGTAGDLAAADLGQTALTAADLLDYLPKAFRKHEDA